KQQINIDTDHVEQNKLNTETNNETNNNTDKQNKPNMETNKNLVDHTYKHNKQSTDPDLKDLFTNTEDITLTSTTQAILPKLNLSYSEITSRFKPELNYMEEDTEIKWNEDFQNAISNQVE